MKVLIVKLSSMGDIIHTLPAVTDAANSILNIEFDWVVEETFSEILRWHPAVFKVIPVNLRMWIRNFYHFSSWKQYYYFISRLTKKEYDIVIDAQGLLKTSLLITRIARGEVHGMDCESVRETMSVFFYHKKHFIEKKQHSIERIRQLFSCSLGYSVPQAMGQYGLRSLFLRKKNNVPYLIFFHSTTKAKKHWPEFYWHFIIKYAISSGYHIKLPFWGRSEELRVRRLVASYTHQTTILSKLTLRDIAVQISGATAIISVDTGLSHLAAVLGCPNLTLYGPTDPKLIGTCGKNQVILHSATKKMENLSPEEVWEVFQKVLNM
ncbi:lipopolysaccharide heptosyltransferase I [Candidatus Blochmannia ocreatus (nom. nud.)]|uniref:Lipopolysaccharide heptosyltransferase 1 n=1 Tax=Candidatus Blochmannia ocreatus (nom. nud.) TaxID=251538 RepID=A0ABY4SVV7_9ENTR|nr:lipopolysaccharide heptosyltransferase I [Candidatus Blochmannia ocreatus]URJ25075.1 lipopolysaccharide heptosyltransferase I [Candidatus Blochmannia ocreatus]